MKKSTELLHNKLLEQEMRKFVLDCYPVSSVENFVFRIKILLCNDRIFVPRLQETSSLLFLGAVQTGIFMWMAPASYGSSVCTAHWCWRRRFPHFSK